MIGSDLTEADFSKLAESYITPELAVCAGLRRVNSAEGALLVGRAGRGDFAGIAFPYYWPGESQPREFRLRLDHPTIELKDGKHKEKAKYLSPPGRGCLLYFAPDTTPAMLTDVSLTIVIVEGEKKVLSMWRAANEGTDAPRFLPIGVAGVWGWRGKRGIEPGPDGHRRQVKGPIADLDRIIWKGRKVILAFDSDTAQNQSNQDARRELARELGRPA